MTSESKNKGKAHNKEYHIYYGIPHCHTAASTGKGTVKDAVEYAKSNGMDFIILSDHSAYLNKAGAEHKTIWEHQKEEIKRYRHHHKGILPVLGFEYKLFQKLDVNIITDRACINSRLSIEEFKKWLKKYNGIGIINHPGESIKKIKSSLELNQFITCIETGNGRFPSRYQRYYKSYFSLLDLGWKLAAVNGQDNHRRDWGDSDNVTAIISKRLSYDSLIRAFLERRTYSTESRTLKIQFMINNSIMGDILRVSKNQILTFRISAEDETNCIKSIRIYSNNGILIKDTENFAEGKAELNFTAESPCENSWYVVNVIMQDNREAITSPIFIEPVELSE